MIMASIRRGTGIHSPRLLTLYLLNPKEGPDLLAILAVGGVSQAAGTCP